MTGIYKSFEQNYQDALVEVHQLETEEIEHDLKLRLAFHNWYVAALVVELATREFEEMLGPVRGCC
jgi:hypothetical protein